MTRLAFVIPNMLGGGAARVASILCSAWAERGLDVHLMSFEDDEHAPAYPLSDKITRHRLGLHKSAPGLVGFTRTNVSRVGRLRSALRQTRPDAVIAFLIDANVPAVLAARSLRLPIIVSERNHPAHFPVSAFKNHAREVSYRRASSVVVQTRDIAHWFDRELGITARVVPNPFDEPPALTHREQRTRNGRKRVISLGRLEPQKGFDRLIDAFAILASDAPDWDLVIFGEGAERQHLQDRITAHALDGRIRLPGVTQTPQQELRETDLYVHPARYEGFPNALLEAMAAGLCVVATDCPGASGELLEGGTAGFLVADAGPDALADGMRRAMADNALRKTLGQHAALTVRERFSVNTVLDIWATELARVSPAIRDSQSSGR